MHAHLLHASVSSAPAVAPTAAGAAGGAVGLGYGIAVAVGVLVFISTVMLASYLCARAKAGAANAASVLLVDAPVAPSAVAVLGLDGPAIDALYPKFLHAGSPGGNDGRACTAGGPCAICLGDFAAGDALRRGPGCGHCFHAGCAERWLRVSATCPTCRDSPVPSPVATPLAAHAR